MIDSSDLSTQTAVLELRELRSRKRPVLLWVGAGASRWSGFPSWLDFAELVHTHFLKYQANYDSRLAHQFLKSNELPKFFSLARVADSSRFYGFLSDTFQNRDTPPVYKRLIDVLTRVSPLCILTTNVDEMLEANIPMLRRFQHTDIELAVRALAEGQSFLCKLHGTISSSESTVWTEEDYSALQGNAPFTSALAHLIRGSSVVFLGYGLRDDYVLDILRRNNDVQPLLGDGPHFLVTAQARPTTLPESVRIVRYLTSTQTDHRGAIAVLELLGNTTHVPNMARHESGLKRTSAMYLTDFIPPGTWTTSNTITARNADGVTIKAIVGTGFVDAEIPLRVTTSLHDLLVGLICFDKVFLPLGSLGLLHKELGSEVFWRIVEEDAIGFVWIGNELSVVFPDKDADANGDLCQLTLMDKAHPDKPLTFDEAVARQITPTPDSGDARAHVANRVRRITAFLPEDSLKDVPALARGALVSPVLRNHLGIGDAIIPSKLPVWFTFPALRVARVVQDAEICRLLGLVSATMPFGSSALANATYGLTAPDINADQIASYVLVGQFNANLGILLHQDPKILFEILRFRDSAVGMNLRKEVFDQLKVNAGAELVASVNAGLNAFVSVETLSKARGEFVNLLMSAGSVAVWSIKHPEPNPFTLWQARSASILREYCSANRIGPYDSCPCGSGDKLRFCCGLLLR